MPEYFETGKLDKFGNDLIQLLVNHRYLIPQVKKVEPKPELKEVFREAKEEVSTWRPEQRSVDPLGSQESENKYLTMHVSVESVFEQISRDYLGTCEDKKFFEKELKKAVKEYGHDALILAFETWCGNQSGFVSGKPITNFLRNAGQYVNATAKPLVTNPILDKTEKRIALLTDNKIVFVGTYRIQLASVLKEYGENLTLMAFEEFYKNLEDKQIPWAARDFLQRASVIIWTINEKDRQALEQEKQILAAYQKAAAATSVEEIEEDEEEL